MNRTLIFLTLFIILCIYTCYSNNIETFAVDASTKEEIKKAVNETFVADVDAIRNLSEVAIKLQAGGLILPGDGNVKGNLNVDGITTIQGKEIDPNYRHVIDLTKGTADRFYPVALTGHTPDMGGSPSYRRYTFILNKLNQGAGESFNNHFLYGTVNSGGWSDLWPSDYDIYHNFFDPAERSILAVYRGLQNCGGVIFYLRGGPNAKYYISTNSRGISFNTTAAINIGDGATNNAVFGIKNSSGADVVGTTSNGEELVNFLNRPAGRYTSQINISTKNKNDALVINPDGNTTLNGNTTINDNATINGTTTINGNIVMTDSILRMLSGIPNNIIFNISANNYGQFISQIKLNTTNNDPVITTENDLGIPTVANITDGNGVIIFDRIWGFGSTGIKLPGINYRINSWYCLDLSKISNFNPNGLYNIWGNVDDHMVININGVNVWGNVSGFGTFFINNSPKIYISLMHTQWGSGVSGIVRLRQVTPY